MTTPKDFPGPYQCGACKRLFDTRMYCHCQGPGSCQAVPVSTHRYAFRCFGHVSFAPEYPQEMWLCDPARGLGCSSNPHEAHLFTLDESDKMIPTLNTVSAVGTTTRFAQLWQYERVTLDDVSRAIRQYSEAA